MAKQKAPTPQELYRQRRLREEQERTAYLPPGMINHGNTCFMNSVLQGLIATRLLSDLVHFAPIPPSIQEHATTVLSAKRSPHLTNGHNLAGPYEQAWVNSMPIGDQFLSVVYKGWEYQAARRKDILSPKPVLSALGRKYDQYLDFAQQDAHEFLRILLDAMRMEEQDIIKKRQPPTPPQKKRRRSTLVQPPASSSPNLAPREMAEDEKLMSFVDMIFGGRLTSILVCQKCKHVSQTYEDFNDISLSIKPEDYKKKNRLKNLAKRLTNFPAPGLPRFVAAEIQRSSSVPPSPRERPDGQLIGKEESPPSTSRRRSLEIHPTDTQGEPQASEDKNPDATPDPIGSAPVVSVTGPSEEKSDEFVEVQSGGVEEKDKDREEKKKEKEPEDSNWAKIGRRLSLTVGLGKPKDKKARSQNRVSAPILEGIALDIPKETTNGKLSATNSMPNPVAHTTSRGSSVDGRAVLSPQPKVATPARHSLDSRLPASTHEPVSIYPIPPAIPKDKESKVLRSKSPKPPKASPGEVEYLRKILADVDTGSSSNPFSIFKPQQQSSSSSSAIHQNAWLGLKTLSGIEECLRMFTAVEVLDKENMVGCRRCWKIANGIIPNTNAVNDKMDDDDSDGGEQEPVRSSNSDNDNQPISLTIPSESHSISIVAPSPVRPGPHPSINLPTSVSTPTVSFYGANKNLDDDEHLKGDTRSISSLPVQVEERTPSPSRSVSSVDGTISDRTPGGLPIPLISTTEPDSPPSSATSITDVSASDDSDSAEGSGPALPNGISSPKPPSTIANLNGATSALGSLPVPPRRFGNRKAGDTATDDDSSDDESDTSVGTSVSASSSASRLASPPGHLNGVHPQPNSPATPTPSAASPSQPPLLKKPSKPKPTIMRPAYKRYLIATPPTSARYPFEAFPANQQDPISILFTWKEDYGLGKKGRKLSKGGRDSKEKERCMYRLYAVVVHIGNMLGGHYVAYTALPSRSPIEGEGLATATQPPTANVTGPENSTASSPPPVPETSPNPASSSTPVSASSSSPSLSRQGSAPKVATSTSTASQDKPVERQWAYISDTVVRLTTLEEVLNTKAYICMYERC
ncbi:hypothetical protein BKA70DRAFT_1571715 [Coprinopsis sp. MPI-PUGE-AT-0042]|nr:hypothetical protein BKA70DRAFT_1571715 [Coprinopsis sp. MPI-PUGE-AT-0042]